jgi:16S rRNA (guanine527-N7)-methyltransferase
MPPELLSILTEAQQAGFLGPGALERQLRHARGFAAIARRLGAPTTGGPAPKVADLGSGGGLPALVVASQWPEVSMALIEANGRRATFLRVALDRLGLSERVRVLEERAETCGRVDTTRGSFDGVTARSFGRPGVVAECAAPLLKPGGWLLVSEPPSGQTQREPRWPGEPLHQLGLVAEGRVHEEFEYQVLRQSELCPDRFPRRNGVPAKRPLF